MGQVPITASVLHSMSWMPLDHLAPPYILPTIARKKQHRHRSWLNTRVRLWHQALNGCGMIGNWRGRKWRGNKRDGRWTRMAETRWIWQSRTTHRRLGLSEQMRALGPNGGCQLKTNKRTWSCRANCWVMDRQADITSAQLTIKRKCGGVNLIAQNYLHICTIQQDPRIQAYSQETAK